MKKLGHSTYARLTREVEVQAVRAFSSGLYTSDLDARRCHHEDARLLADLAHALRCRAAPPVVKRMVDRLDTALRERLPEALQELYWTSASELRRGGVA